MATQNNHKKLFDGFKEGDLVSFVYVEQGNHPQVWKRIEGLGVILSKRKTLEDSTFIYTVLSNGESFECVEVYSLEEYAMMSNNETNNNEE